MNSCIKKTVTSGLALAGLLMVASPSAFAAASFSSATSVNLTITGITNLTNAGDISGLQVSGSAELPPDQIFTFISGNGTVTPLLDNVGAATVTPAVGNTYGSKFELTGSADEGEVETQYLALFNLNFNNISAADTYAIDLTFSYQLDASVAGEIAASSVGIDYSNGSFFGSDAISVFSDSLISDSVQNTQAFTITLNAGQIQLVNANAVINGSLSVANVPVPAAFWLFGSALLGYARLKQTKKLA